MNWPRIRVVMRKEWLEVRRNKMILFAMGLLPLVMVGMVVFSALAVSWMSPDEIAKADFVPPAGLEGYGPIDAVMVIINDQNLMYLILTPMLLPIVIGAYSIIGERQTKSLEPLLATPVTTGELVVGKALAAASPALVIGLLQYAAALIGIGSVCSANVFEHAYRPLWIVGILVAMPLLTLFSTLLSVIVSSKMSDVRAAQAVSSLVILPVLGAGMTVLIGQVYLTVGVMVGACALLLLFDAGAAWIAVQVFDRERILTRR